MEKKKGMVQAMKKFTKAAVGFMAAVMLTVFTFPADVLAQTEAAGAENGQSVTQENVKVEFYSGCAPGERKTPPVEITAIKSAKLITSADGSRQLTFELGETVVFGLYGHIGSLRIMDSESMESAYTESLANDFTKLKEAVYNTWYTDKITQEADETVFEGTPKQVVDASGNVYYTADGSALAENATTTDSENLLVFPKDAVINVPEYFDLAENNEIYVRCYIDAMGRDSFMKLVLTEESEAVVKQGTAHIAQFGEYDVNVEVTTKDGKITALEITGENFAGTYAEYNKRILQQAVDGLKESYLGKSITDPAEIASVDAVSGATYSSNAIRDAILNALSLEIEDEPIILPTEKLKEGTYTVDLAFYTDKVKHSLVENEKATGTITVDKDGNMILTVDIINGTEKAPLYVYSFNGYYEENDTTKPLKTDALITTEDTEYTDSVFGPEEKIVTKVSFPLEGEFASVYNTNASIYVPAMKNLNGEVAGILFQQGRFRADCFAEIYWDSLKQVSQEETSEFLFGESKTKLEPGEYKLPVAMKNASNLNQDSMAASCLKGAVLTVNEDGTAAITINLQAISVGAITSWATDWKVYQTSQPGGEAAAVTEYKNTDGNVEQITFILPDNSWDGVYINMYVSAMAYSPDAYLAFDFANAESASIKDGIYNVPVSIKKASDSSTDSMSNSAVNPVALVTVKNGKAAYKLTFHGITIEGLEAKGHLVKLWSYAEGINSEKTEAVAGEFYEDDGVTYPGSFTILRERAGESEIYVRVSVDAMVGFDQDALVKFDWNQATWNQTPVTPDIPETKPTAMPTQVPAINPTAVPTQIPTATSAPTQAPLKVGSVKLSKTTYTYNKKVCKPVVSVTDSNGKKISSNNYTVKYQNAKSKNPGSYKVTVSFKGAYSNTKTKTLYYTIKPSKVKVTVKKNTNNSAVITWKKVTGVTKYEIQYSTNSKFKKAKKITTSAKVTSKKLTSLKENKKYYIRVRSYKSVKVNGKSKKLYSDWSKQVVISTKK